MRGSRVLVSGLFLSSIFIVLPSTFADSPAPPERFRAWLADVDPLITSRERETFLKLSTDVDREAFIQRFWEVRDPFPSTSATRPRSAGRSGCRTPIGVGEGLAMTEPGSSCSTASRTASSPGSATVRLWSCGCTSPGSSSSTAPCSSFYQTRRVGLPGSGRPEKDGTFSPL